MKDFLNSIKNRGISETIILSLWLVYRKLVSLIAISLFRLRGYRIAYSTIFYGRSWLQRSMKNSIIVGEKCGVGDNVKLRCYGKGKIKIGNNVSINENTIIHAGKLVEIGNDTIIGANCYINDTSHTFKSLKIPINQQGWNAEAIIIEDNVWLGANVTILDGIKLGTGSVVGAGAVVTKNVAQNTIVAGVPAKVLYKRLP
ncbi:MAG TPA: acyltransferase [Patescibacteria group bacterium]|nr:acyltransferase [Patescibacteria group bacterium]